MSLSPSNEISERLTGRSTFPNYAGLGLRSPREVDDKTAMELVEAGIEVFTLPESMREKMGGECYTITTGCLHGWRFTRAWYYWIAKGPGIPIQYAMPLHEQHGTSVRVDGHCGCPSPLEYAHGFPITCYNIDNPEGLDALAEVIRRIKAAGDVMLRVAKTKGGRPASKPGAGAEPPFPADGVTAPQCR